jgi:hypothetical protein
MEASGVLGVFFLAMPMFLMLRMSTPILWNTGRKHLEVMLQLPLLLLAVFAFYQFVPWGIRAAAMVGAGLLFCRGLVVGIASFRALSLAPMDLLPNLLRGGILSFLAVSTAWLGGEAAGGLGSPAVSLLVAGFLTSASILTLIWVWPHILGDQAATMVVRFVPSMRTFLMRRSERGSGLSGEGGSDVSS